MNPARSWIMPLIMDLPAKYNQKPESRGWFWKMKPDNSINEGWKRAIGLLIIKNIRWIYKLTIEYIIMKNNLSKGALHPYSQHKSFPGFTLTYIFFAQWTFWSKTHSGLGEDLGCTPTILKPTPYGTLFLGWRSCGVIPLHDLDDVADAFMIWRTGLCPDKNGLVYTMCIVHRNMYAYSNQTIKDLLYRLYRIHVM